VACSSWPILKVDDRHMAASECIYFMSGKIDKGRGAEVSFVRPILKERNV